MQLGVNVPSTLKACATENAGDNASPDVTVGQSDLKYSFQLPSTLANWQTSGLSITVCPNPVALAHTGIGMFSQPLFLGLFIANGDSPGSFSSVVTFTVEPS
jgi:hypothetical protein